MKASNVIFNVFLIVTLIYFAISVYGLIFGEPIAYEFSEFGRDCIVVQEGAGMAMWCETKEMNYEQ